MQTNSEAYASAADGFLLVYALDSRQSFNDISNFRERVLFLKGRETVPMLLLANKHDLQGCREVSSEEGAQRAAEMGCGFYETSAKEHTSVVTPFLDIIRASRRDRLATSQARPSARGKPPACLLL